MRRHLISLALGISTVSLAPTWARPAAEQAIAADLVLRNGRLLTPDGWATAMAVSHGTIVAIGDETAVAPYRGVSPQGLVPALEVDGVALTQSPAILEWPEERYPAPALLPRDANERAVVRAMASLVACDIHPLNNLRVLTALRQQFHAGEADVSAWIARWIHDGFAALERLVQRHGGLFCFGDAASLADCCLIPQVYAARRFGVALDSHAAIVAIADRANAIEAFAAAAPDRQPDADAV